jgi:hypothetical protein
LEFAFTTLMAARAIAAAERAAKGERQEETREEPA